MPLPPKAIVVVWQGPAGQTIVHAIAHDEYCDSYAAMVCGVASDCDCLTGYSVELCQTYARAECVSDVEEPVNAGRMAYNDKDGTSCINELWSIINDCNLNDAYWPEACDDMPVGLVAAGGDCGEEVDDVCDEMPI